MRLSLIRVLVASLTLLCLGAKAEIVPEKGDADPRIRFLDYTADNVVRVTTFYGVSTHIQLASDENITAVAVGDKEAWEIVPRGNHLFVRPKQQVADTNVTVVSNKRVYQFAFVVQNKEITDKTAWSNANLIYSLTFRYPGDDQAKQDTVAAEKRAADEKLAVQTALKEAAKITSNTNYWVAGTREISPTSARDDGRFTYLSFGRNRDMPAVFWVDAEGEEHRAPVTVDGNTIVIQRLYPVLMLRKGNAVARVVNKSYNADSGRDSPTGTVSAQVERVVKGSR